MRAVLLMFLSAFACATAQASEDALAGLVGTAIEAEVVALDGATLLVLGPVRPADLPDILEPVLPAPIEPGKTRIQLWGIAAPEMKERGRWQALGALDDLLATAGGRVRCQLVDTHKGRLVGRCHTFATVSDGRIDEGAGLGTAMIESGWVTPYRIVTWAPVTESGDPALARLYDTAMAEARAARRGLWRLP